MLDVDSFAAEVVRGTTALMEKRLAPLMTRIDEIEARLDNLPVPENGNDADPGAVAKMVREDLKADFDDIRKSIADIPAGKDGKDGEKGEKGDIGPAGKDGADVVATIKDADGHLILTLSNGQVADVGKVVGADGKDGLNGKDGVDGKDGANGKDGLDGKDGVDGADGKDGADVVAAIKDADGHLIFTMSDGSTRDVGRVMGRDGMDGEKGESGQDGRDGFGFDDMTVDYDGERTVTFKWARDDDTVEKQFVMPVILDRGVFSDAKTYDKGDGVTYGGSLWIAQEETSERPGKGKTWRLAVKKGRDGRNGELKPPPDKKPIKV